MKAVYKYAFTIETAAESELGQAIIIPSGAEILKVGVQFDLHHEGFPCIWALVDVDAPGPGVMRHIKVFGTGWPIENPNLWNYLGTIQIHHHIWHIFERNKSS